MVRRSLLMLADLRPVWHFLIERKQNHVGLGQNSAENENVRSVARHAPRREVHDGCNLPAHEAFRAIPHAYLCAGLFEADLPKIDLQLQSGVSGGRMWPRRHHGADADVEVLKLIEGWHA